MNRNGSGPKTALDKRSKKRSCSQILRPRNRNGSGSKTTRNRRSTMNPAPRYCGPATKSAENPFYKSFIPLSHACQYTNRPRIFSIARDPSFRKSVRSQRRGVEPGTPPEYYKHANYTLASTKETGYPRELEKQNKEHTKYQKQNNNLEAEDGEGGGPTQT